MEPMATIRKIVFLNGYYYHIFNRGIDKRPTFLNLREYKRILDLLYFYQFSNLPISYSRYQQMSIEIQKEYLKKIESLPKLVEIAAYCIMPNHYHLLIKQIMERGITTYVANFQNAYTKYFNTRHKRKGVLFEGVFKSVFVEPHILEPKAVVYG